MVCLAQIRLSNLPSIDLVGFDEPSVTATRRLSMYWQYDLALAVILISERYMKDL